MLLIPVGIKVTPPIVLTTTVDPVDGVVVELEEIVIVIGIPVVDTLPLL